MITLLLVVLAITITYLVTDYRNHQNALHLPRTIAELETQLERSYTLGHEDGVAHAKTMQMLDNMRHQ